MIVQAAFGQDIQERLDDLYSSAAHYALMENDEDIADSLSREAIELAESTLDEALVSEAVVEYLNRDKHGNPNVIPSDLLKKIEELERTITQSDRKFEIWVGLARLLRGKQYEKAQLYSRQAMSFAASNESSEVKVNAYLAAAKVAMQGADNNDQKQEAFRNILLAQNEIPELEDNCRADLALRIKALKAEFFYGNKIYSKARDIKQDIINDLSQVDVVDSTALMWAKYDLTKYARFEKPDISIRERMQEILAFSKRTNNLLLEEFAMALYRHHLVENLSLGEFHEQIRPYYRQKAGKLNVDELAIYCASSALFCEHEGRLDSAEIFYLHAIGYEHKNLARQANIWRRYGEFLLRNKKEKEAYEAFKQGLAINEKQRIGERTLLAITTALDSLAHKNGDYKKAYGYSSLRLDAITKIDEAQIDVALMQMELENQEHQNEENLLREAEIKKRKNTIQYWAIGIAVIILFVILAIVSSMAVPAWIIEMLGFFSVLFVFEFVLLLMDAKIKSFTDGNLIAIFLIKVAILSVIFPLHHVIEQGVTGYMVKHQLIKAPKRTIVRKFLEKLYPWLDPDHEAGAH